MILLCVTLIVIKEFREQTKYICKFDGACIDDMYIPRLLLFIKCMCSDVSIFLEQIHGENSASSLLNMIQCSTIKVIYFNDVYTPQVSWYNIARNHITEKVEIVSKICIP